MVTDAEAVEIIEARLNKIGYFPEGKIKVNEVLEKAREISVSDNVKVKIIDILKNGKIVASYRGFACCRICGTILGSHDLEYGGFVFPSRWEHYITDHNVLPVFQLSEITTEFIDRCAEQSKSV